MLDAFALLLFPKIFRHNYRKPNRFVINFFSSGTNQVHIVFDNHGRLPNTPKAFERKRRDSERQKRLRESGEILSEQYHLIISMCAFLMHVLFPAIGGTVSLAEHGNGPYLGECFLQNALATCKMKQYQQFVVAGYDDIAWGVGVNGVNPIPELSCNAEEADTLHALKSEGPHKLLCSSDTDVYHIGLPLIPCESSEVYIL